MKHFIRCYSYTQQSTCSLYAKGITMYIGLPLHFNNKMPVLYTWVGIWHIQFHLNVAFELGTFVAFDFQTNKRRIVIRQAFKHSRAANSKRK